MRLESVAFGGIYLSVECKIEHRWCGSIFSHILH